MINPLTQRPLTDQEKDKGRKAKQGKRDGGTCGREKERAESSARPRWLCLPTAAIRSMMVTVVTDEPLPMMVFVVVVVVTVTR